MENKEQHHSDTLLMGAILFFIGGFSNVYTYINCEQIFANLQTGNMTLMVVSLVNGNYTKIPRYITQVLSFCLGTCLGTIISVKEVNNKKIHWRTILLIFQLVSVIIAGFIPNSHNLIIAALIAFNSAMTSEAFKKISNRAIMSTMMVGNLKKIVEYFTKYLMKHDDYDKTEFLTILLLFIVFFIGCLICGYLSTIFGSKTIWFLIPLYIIAIIYLQKDQVRKENKNI